MKKQTTYDLIAHRLPSTGSTDSHALWLDMQARLDREMPQEKEERPAWMWLFSRGGCIMLLCLALCTSLAVYLNVKSKDSYASRFFVVNHGKRGSEVRPISTQSAPATAPSQPGAVTVEHKPIEQKGSAETGSKRQQMDADIAAGTSHITAAAGPSQKEAVVPQTHISAKAGKATHPEKALTNLDRITSNQKTNEGLTVEKTRSNLAPANTSSPEIAVAPSPSFTPSLHKVQALPRESRVDTLYRIAYTKLALRDTPALSMPGIAKARTLRQKGWTAGLGVSLNKALGGQEQSTVGYGGGSNVLMDYLPSVYVQYHFHSKLYVQAELQFIAPQYTTGTDLFQKKFDYTASSYKEHEVSLNKLYYLNLPVSVHYSPVKNLSIGAGLQFSSLRRSILENELCTWQNGPGGWKMVKEEKSIAVHGNPNKEARENGNANGNGNGRGRGRGNSGGGGTTQPVFTPMDTVAQGLRSWEYRILLEADYRRKRFDIGIRWNRGLQSLMKLNDGNGVMPVTERNQSMQLFIRYDLLDLRRKK